jgi:ribonuclease R
MGATNSGKDISRELNSLFAAAKDTPEYNAIELLSLRTMAKARYDIENLGHYGLAFKYYTHFTSPIRRYPDLQIHRIIKENLRKGIAGERRKHYDNILPDVTKNCSINERRAEDAEREVEKMKKTEYMLDKIGQTFDGVISGVTAWGVYVELPNTIEGMVHVNDMEGDYFHFNQSEYEMVGETTHKTYKLGQRVKVRCKGADKFLRTIDFVFCEGE